MILGDSHTRSLEGRKSHKISMTGDSHVRNCATKLQHNLCTNYKISSFVKPFAGIDTIVNTARDEIKILRSEDVVVIGRGANRISKNNTKAAIKHVCNFVEKKKLNIVIMISPHRYDLVSSSCVKNEVLNFNRQVEKKMKIYNNGSMLETVLENTSLGMGST